jgi:imidazolonepropionase-like amidohydrolase
MNNFVQLAEQSKTRPIWLRVGQLIDGVSDRVIKNADVIFDAKKIRSTTPTQAAPDAILPDYTLLPCLIEAHAHMFLDGAPVDFSQRDGYLKNDRDWMLARAKLRWPKILHYGIGTIRDAGDKHGVGLALSAEIKKSQGKLTNVPWIDSPGPAIHHRGRYGSFMGEPIEDYPSPQACVAGRIAAGADRIKLLVSGIINFKVGQVTVPPQMPIDEVKAIVAAARESGRQTFAHASGTEGVENSIEGGVNTVEHGFFITKDQLAKMRDRNIAWVPTFAPVQVQIDRAAELGWDENVVTNLKRIIDSHQKMLRLAHEMGVKIVAGSDAGSCGVPHGLGFLQELVQMEQAGMPPLAILRSATGISAATLNFAEPIGQIAPGCRARFILTKNDPTTTVANLQKDKMIFFDGVALQSDGQQPIEGM